MKAWQHFCTVNYHKKLVLKGCFKIGLYKQGILHDLSKFSPTEFFVGCKYFQGTVSPNNIERKEKGYSAAWLHHKGRNKHHLEYWIDYGANKEHGLGMIGMKMPAKYVAEMFIDRISAAKVYGKENYTNVSPLLYYEQGKDYHILHPDTRALLEKLLLILKEEGEDAVFAYIKKDLLGKKKSRKKGLSC
ncbi:DUF5662 family protein [Lachnospiraceae bacterium ZAX-1]